MVAPIFFLGGEKLKVVFSKVLEKGKAVGGVGGGVRAVADDVIKVSGDAFNAFDYLVDFLMNQPEATLLPYGMMTYSKSWSDLQKAMKGMISLIPSQSPTVTNRYRGGRRGCAVAGGSKGIRSSIAGRCRGVQVG